MEKNVLVAKLKATSVSLAVWVLISSVLGLCTGFLWYPGFLFWTDGGREVLQLMICIDVVLGPLLMFVIFSPTKSQRMKIADFAIVLGIQLAALLYGLYQVHAQSPAVVVYSGQEFHSVRPELLERQKASASMFQKMSEQTPPFLFSATPPVDQQQQILNVSMRLQIPLDAQVVLFRPLKPNAVALFAGDVAIRQLLEKKAAPVYQEFTSRFAADKVKLVWFVGRYADAVLVFDADARFLGYLSLPEGLHNPGASIVPSVVMKPTAHS